MDGQHRDTNHLSGKIPVATRKGKRQWEMESSVRRTSRPSVSGWMIGTSSIKRDQGGYRVLPSSLLWQLQIDFNWFHRSKKLWPSPLSWVVSLPNCPLPSLFNQIYPILKMDEVSDINLNSSLTDGGMCLYCFVCVTIISLLLSNYQQILSDLTCHDILHFYFSSIKRSFQSLAYKRHPNTRCVSVFSIVPVIRLHCFYSWSVDQWMAWTTVWVPG